MLNQPLQAGTHVKALLRITLAFLTAALVPLGARADASIPDTPAGRTLQAFLNAFNSGEHDRIDAYVKQYDPSNNTDGLVAFSGQTGGFNFISVVESTPDRLTFRVHGRGDGIDAYGVMQLASTTPPKVKRLTIRALPPGAKLDDIQLDQAVRQKTIDAIGKQLTDHYIYPEVAAKMIQAIHDHQEHGDYNSMTDGNDFAEALSRDLRAVSYDQHLFVGYNPFVMSEPPGSAAGPHEPSPAEQARFRTMLEHQNCTFSKLET